MNKTDKRRLKEDSLYEVIDKGLELRRTPLTKQKKYKEKVRLLRAEYTFLQNHYIIFKWAVANNNLTLPELNILLYIYPITIFTTSSFQEAQKEIGAIRLNRLTTMKKKGFFIEWSKVENKTYFTMSSKATRLIARMHKMFMMEDQIPMSARRNIIAQSKNPKDKKLMSLFKKFNKKI